MANVLLATPIFDRVLRDMPERPPIDLHVPTKRERHHLNRDIKKWQDQAIAAITPTDA